MAMGGNMNAAVVALSEPTLFVGEGGLFREGLRRLLAHTPFALARETETLEAAWALVQEGSSLRLVLVHAAMDGALDCAGLAKLCRAGSNVHVVILTDHATRAPFAEAVHAGVDGVLLNRTSAEALLHSLRLVLLGEKVFPKKLIHQLLAQNVQAVAAKAPAAKGEANGLSEREGHILKCLADGASNKAIARRLRITEATVKVHLKAILRKIGAANRTQAAIWAISHGADAWPLDRPMRQMDSARDPGRGAPVAQTSRHYPLAMS